MPRVSLFCPSPYPCSLTEANEGNEGTAIALSVRWPGNPKPRGAFRSLRSLRFLLCSSAWIRRRKGRRGKLQFIDQPAASVFEVRCSTFEVQYLTAATAVILAVAAGSAGTSLHLPGRKSRCLQNPYLAQAQEVPAPTASATPSSGPALPG